MSKEFSDVKKLRAELNKAIRRNRLKQYYIEAGCLHRSKKGKVLIRPKKNSNGLVFKCKDCRSKLNFTEYAAKDLDAHAIKKIIKGHVKALVNDINICKFMLNPKGDRKIAEKLIDAQRRVAQVKPYLVAAIGDAFENHKGGFGKKHKKRNKKKGGNGGIKFTAAGKPLR